MGFVSRFDIRVMQSGRLRGQAFVGLPSEHVACQARQDVNGYELQGKPLVVVSVPLVSIGSRCYLVCGCPLQSFARTTKAKETDNIASK